MIERKCPKCNTIMERAIYYAGWKCHECKSWFSDEYFLIHKEKEK
jgi:hypothetical protein